MLIHVNMPTIFKIEHECITSKQIFIKSASFHILLKSGKPRPPTMWGNITCLMRVHWKMVRFGVSPVKCLCPYSDVCAKWTVHCFVWEYISIPRHKRHQWLSWASMRGPRKFCLRGSNWQRALVEDEGREDPNTTISGPSTARQRNADSGPHKIECWLGSFVIFQGIQTRIAKKPYCFFVWPPAPQPPTSGPANCQ